MNEDNNQFFPPEWLREQQELRMATPIERFTVSEVLSLRDRVKDLENVQFWLLISNCLLGLGALIRFVAWVLP